jgi:hypothetical protein
VYARVTHRAWFQVNEKIMLDAHYLKILTDPVDLYLSVRNGVSQYLLYGSALTVLSVFAYRLWRQDQRRLVVILAVASLGYLGPCGLIRNPIFGAYFVAAMFPLSVLAIPAAVECARNWGASLAVGALGVAPFVIEMLTPGWGPLGYLASVLGVFVLLRTQRGKPLPRSLVRSIALIGATALATTHFSLIPQLKRQRFRDDVNYVLERIPRDAVVLICSSSIEENLDAYLYCVYPERIGKGVDLGRTALPILRYNELALDVARLQMEDAFRQIAPTLNKGYTIWVLGDPHCYAPGTRSAEFIARVEASFRLQPVAGAPVQLAELVGRG